MRLGQLRSLVERQTQRVWGGLRIPVLSHQGPFLESFMMGKKAPDSPSGKPEVTTCCHVCHVLRGYVFLVYILPFIKVTRGLVALWLHFRERKGYNYFDRGVPKWLVLKISPLCSRGQNGKFLQKVCSLASGKDPEAVCVCLVGSSCWSCTFACLWCAAYLGEFSQALGNPEEAILGHHFFSGCLAFISLATSPRLYMFATFSLLFSLYLPCCFPCWTNTHLFPQ